MDNVLITLRSPFTKPLRAHLLLYNVGLTGRNLEESFSILKRVPAGVGGGEKMEKES